MLAKRTKQRRIKTPQERVDDRDRAIALIFGNVLLLGLAQIIGRLELQPGVPGNVLGLFSWAEVVVIVSYLLVAGSDSLRRLPFQFGREHEASSSSDQHSNSAVEANSSHLDDARDFPLWIPVFVNFVPIGYLIHQTGGVGSSPYAGVPFAMLLIGQLLQSVETVTDLEPQRFWRTLILGAICNFRISISIVVMFYGILLILGVENPTSAGKAPEGVMVAVTVLLFLAGTMTNYFTRALRRQAK